jgi:hypothetical protein
MAEELAKQTTEAATLRQITQWIIAGHTQADVVDAIAEKYPNEKARPLIVAALKQLAEAGAQPDANLVRGFAMEGTREIYRKATEIGDHQTALRALKQLMDLTKQK